MFGATVTKARRPRLNREQQREARTQQILDAAWAVFLEHGYDNATVEAVAEHAGISRMPIYSLFGDKQTLYYRLSNQFLGQMVETLSAPLRSAKGLREGLEQLAKLLAAGSRERGRQPGPDSLFYVVQVIALSRPDIAAEQRKGALMIIDTFAEAIRGAALARGERLRGTPEGIAALIVAQINGLAAVEFQTGRSYIKSADLAALFHGAAFR